MFYVISLVFNFRTYFPLSLIVFSSWVSFWLVKTDKGKAQLIKKKKNEIIFSRYDQAIQMIRAASKAYIDKKNLIRKWKTSIQKKSDSFVNRSPPSERRFIIFVACLQHLSTKCVNLELRSQGTLPYSFSIQGQEIPARTGLGATCTLAVVTIGKCCCCLQRKQFLLR